MTLNKAEVLRLSRAEAGAFGEVGKKYVSQNLDAWSCVLMVIVLF